MTAEPAVDPVWQPARPVFIRRALINAALTLVVSLAILLALTSYLQTTPMIAVFLGLMAAFAGLYEDIMRWRRVRAERWFIDLPHLMHDGPEGTAMIPLSDIADVRRRLGDATLIQLRSGQRVAVRYLADPDSLIAALDAQRPA